MKKIIAIIMLVSIITLLKACHNAGQAYDFCKNSLGMAKSEVEFELGSPVKVEERSHYYDPVFFYLHTYSSLIEIRYSSDSKVTYMLCAEG